MQNEIKFRCSQLGKLMTEPRSKSELLSETTKTYLTEVYIGLKYGRTKEITSKYFDKGNGCEEDSITLFSRVTGKMYFKNEENVRNEYITGTPDLFEGEMITAATLVPDIKTSWDIFSFFKAKQDSLNKDYYWQLQGYMWLTGAQKAQLVYCLVDTPETLIGKEKMNLYYKMIDPTAEEIETAYAEVERNSRYEDIPISERCHIIEIERNNADIERLKARIEDCRNYIHETFNF